ncbi:MAG: hypothetical protein UR77_C0018G0011 [Candidatus Nomurabacteria bacterium GW2011_GWC2_35_35]|nr:MAG: hypothetical protein UR77_C0018G0011 [Candidatus Nomurabacteria bacterium GW2011_GWC2_35_35]
MQKKELQRNYKKKNDKWSERSFLLGASKIIKKQRNIKFIKQSIWQSFASELLVVQENNKWSTIFIF